MTKAQNVVSTMKNNPIFIEIERTAKQMELLQQNISAQVQYKPIALDCRVSAEILDIKNCYLNPSIGMSLTERIFSNYSSLRLPDIKEFSLINVPEVNEAIINNRLVFKEIGNEILSSPAYRERANQTQAIIGTDNIEGKLALDYITDERTEIPLNRSIIASVQKYLDKIHDIPIVKIFGSITSVGQGALFWVSVFSLFYKGPASVFSWCEPQILPLFNEQTPAITYFMGDQYYYEAPIIIGNEALKNPILNVASEDIEAKSADITEDK